MAKKKERKAPAVARSEVFLIGSAGSSQVLESYRLIKSRLFDVHPFIELTLKGGKKTLLAKGIIGHVEPLT